MGGIEAGSARHADDGQTRHQEGDADEGQRIKEPAELPEPGGVGALEDQTGHEEQGRQRQAEGDREHHATLQGQPIQGEDADDDQAGVGDHGKGQEPAQVLLHHGEQGGVKDADHGETNDEGLPFLDRRREQGQHETQQAVDADLEPKQEGWGQGDVAMLGQGWQPAVQGKEGGTDRQAIEQQVEGEGLKGRIHPQALQLDEVECPATALGMGLSPAEEQGARQQQRQGRAHEFVEDLQGGVHARRGGPASQDSPDQPDLDGERQDEPEQVQGREHQHQAGLDGQDQRHQAPGWPQAAHRPIDGDQQGEKAGEQDEQDTDPVHRGVIVQPPPEVPLLGELQGGLGGVVVEIKQDGEQQFDPGQTDARHEGKRLATQEQHQAGTRQGQELQDRQEGPGDLGTPGDFARWHLKDHPQGGQDDEEEVAGPGEQTFDLIGQVGQALDGRQQALATPA